MMHASREGLEFISRFEGLSLSPYKCPANYWTVGYGHRIREGEEDLFKGLASQEDAIKLLQLDVRDAEQAVNACVQIPLTQNQFDALVSLVFNIGSGNFKKSILRVVINKQDRPAISRHWLQWRMAGGKVLAGLERRRKEELRLFYA